MAEETKTKGADAENVAPLTPKTEKSKSKLKESAKPEEGTVVEFADKIWIEGTGESKHLPKGKKFEVQRLHGEQLISKGSAKQTTAPPKPKPAAKKTKDIDEDDD